MNVHLLAELIVILCSLPIYSNCRQSVAQVRFPLSLWRNPLHGQLDWLPTSYEESELNPTWANSPHVLRHHNGATTVQRDNSTTHLSNKSLQNSERQTVDQSKAHYSNAEALVYKVKQIKEFIPQMKPYYLNKIPADYQEGRSVFHPMETIRNLPLGIMTERKYDKMKTIKPNKTLELINQDLSQNKRSNIHPQTCQTSSLPLLISGNYYRP